MNQINTLLLSLMMAFMFTGVISAEETTSSTSGTMVCPICHHIREADDDYARKAGATLARGTLNTFLGWTDIIRQPAKDARSGGNVLEGMASGLSQGVTRTLGGVAEILTFWTPKDEEKYMLFANDCPICAGTQKPTE